MKHNKTGISLGRSGTVVNENVAKYMYKSVDICAHPDNRHHVNAELITHVPEVKPN